MSPFKSSVYRNVYKCATPYLINGRSLKQRPEHVRALVRGQSSHKVIRVTSLGRDTIFNCWSALYLDPRDLRETARAALFEHENHNKGVYKMGSLRAFF